MQYENGTVTMQIIDHKYWFFHTTNSHFQRLARFQVCVSKMYGRAKKYLSFEFPRFLFKKKLQTLSE